MQDCSPCSQICSTGDAYAHVRHWNLNVEFYWRTMFDPNDELYKLVARFNRHAVQHIDNQLSQISYLLKKDHKETRTAIQGLSREVGMLRQETLEHSRRTNDLLERLVVGTKLEDPIS